MYMCVQLYRSFCGRHMPTPLKGRGRLQTTAVPVRDKWTQLQVSRTELTNDSLSLSLFSARTDDGEKREYAEDKVRIDRGTLQLWPP